MPIHLRRRIRQRLALGQFGIFRERRGRARHRRGDRSGTQRKNQSGMPRSLERRTRRSVEEDRRLYKIPRFRPRNSAGSCGQERKHRRTLDRKRLHSRRRWRLADRRTESCRLRRSRDESSERSDSSRHTRYQKCVGFGCQTSRQGRI